MVKDAPQTTEPEIDPGAATPAEVDDGVADDFIDVIADITGQPQEVPEPDVTTKEIVVAQPEADKDVTITELPLPADDFDVFANEKVARVTPKSNVLPEQFEKAQDIRQKVDDVAENPNMRFISSLLSGDDSHGLF